MRLALGDMRLLCARGASRCMVRRECRYPMKGALPDSTGRALRRANSSGLPQHRVRSRKGRRAAARARSAAPRRKQRWLAATTSSRPDDVQQRSPSHFALATKQAPFHGCRWMVSTPTSRGDPPWLVSKRAGPPQPSSRRGVSRRRRWRLGGWCRLLGSSRGRISGSRRRGCGCRRWRATRVRSANSATTPSASSRRRAEPGRGRRCGSGPALRATPGV